MCVRQPWGVTQRHTHTHGQVLRVGASRGYGHLVRTRQVKEKAKYAVQKLRDDLDASRANEQRLQQDLQTLRHSAQEEALRAPPMAIPVAAWPAPEVCAPLHLRSRCGLHALLLLPEVLYSQRSMALHSWLGLYDLPEFCSILLDGLVRTGVVDFTPPVILP